VEDPTSGDPVQIIHSNVHACEYGTGCDPFRDGRKFSDKTPNQVSNFTDNTASFHANELIFPLPGEYSVLAHLILPDSMTNESRFDYAVYTRVTVEQGSVDEKDDQTHAETQEDDVSTEIVIAIIAACVLVIIMIIVAVIIVRNRNKNAEKNQQSYEGFSTPSSNPQFSLHGFPMDHASNKSSNRTSMTSTDPSSYYFSTAVSRQHYPPSSYDPVDTFDVENASNANMNYEQSGRSTASSKASYQPEYHVDADIRYQTPTVASLPQQQHIPYGCPQGCQQSATSGASSALSGKDTRTGRGHVSVQDNGNNQQGAGGSRVSIHQNGDWEI
jgi:hypothetical protein